MSSFKIIKDPLDSGLMWISNNLLIDMLIWFYMVNLTHAAGVSFVYQYAHVLFKL